jgi:hypothetical protein
MLGHSPQCKGGGPFANMQHCRACRTNDPFWRNCGELRHSWNSAWIRSSSEVNDDAHAYNVLMSNNG